MKMQILREYRDWLARKPVLFNFLRKIIEFNFVSLKKVIIKEFSLDSLTEISEKKEILDLPCGTGEFCRIFDYANYTGIDISEVYIDYARKTHKRRFYCRDARMTGFGDSYFDRILTVGFFHHLDISGINAALKEAKRVLKKEGKFLLIEDAPVGSKWNFVGRFLQRYDIGDKIRPREEYGRIIENYFVIDKYYRVKSGFWEYSVFVLSPG